MPKRHGVGLHGAPATRDRQKLNGPTIAQSELIEVEGSYDIDLVIIERGNPSLAIRQTKCIEVDRRHTAVTVAITKEPMEVNEE
jgi:hypothetical protein